MNDYQNPMNAIVAVRISSTKQGMEGDSPKAQKEQIQRFTMSRGIRVIETFEFMESASKLKQPMQDAVDYCKDPKHDVQLFIVKSIDRLTRGGSYVYSDLKLQLEKSGVRLVDIHGIIGAKKVNTLEHLGVSYPWSVYDPTKNSEILEAERASDEKRDTMSRVIGAEVRYTRMGYLMRRAPYGFFSQKVETRNGKRCLLKPLTSESELVIKIFNLRARGTLTDKQIIERINKLGYLSRSSLQRDRKNRLVIIGDRGGKSLTTKAMAVLLSRPIYAGILCEKWTDYRPIQARFTGLVSIETFNKANRGKITIVRHGREIIIEKGKPKILTHKVARYNYPYKKIISCPQCGNALIGSASRGKLGKYYPAYHCSHHGHYFRVPKKILEDVINQFMKGVSITSHYKTKIIDTVLDKWSERQEEVMKDQEVIDVRISELRAQSKTIINNLKFFTSPSTIAHMEEELTDIDRRIVELEAEKPQEINTEANLKMIRDDVNKMLDNIYDLLFDTSDQDLLSIRLGVLFNGKPKYDGLTALMQGEESSTHMSQIFQYKET